MTPELLSPPPHSLRDLAAMAAPETTVGTSPRDFTEILYRLTQHGDSPYVMYITQETKNRMRWAVYGTSVERARLSTQRRYRHVRKGRAHR